MPKNSVKWRTEEQRSRIKQRDQLGQAQHLQPQPASEFPRGRALQLQLKSLSSSLHCSPCLSLSLSLVRSACLLSASLGIYSFMHFVSVSLFFHMQIFLRFVFYKVHDICMWTL